MAMEAMVTPERRKTLPPAMAFYFERCIQIWRPSERRFDMGSHRLPGPHHPHSLPSEGQASTRFCEPKGDDSIAGTTQRLSHDDCCLD